MAQIKPAFMSSKWWDEKEQRPKEGAPKRIVDAWLEFMEQDTPAPPPMPDFSDLPTKKK